MSYTLRKGLELVYAMVGQNGATSAIGMDNQFIVLANSALNMIYNYGGYRRSRQHQKDLFLLNDSTKTRWKLKTKYPIKEVDRFSSSSWVNNDTGQSACDITCDLESDDVVSPCDNICNIDGESNLKLVEILPKNVLCPGSYAVSGGNRDAKFGGDAGSIIDVKLNSSVNTLWVSYFADIVHLKNYDDILPFPDKFLTAWAFFVAGHVTPLYGIMMQQQDLNFFSLARKELDSLKAGEIMGFEEIKLDEKSYPIQSNVNVPFNL